MRTSGSVPEPRVSVGTVIGPRQLAWPMIGCGLGDWTGLGWASLLYINMILTWFIIHQLLQYFQGLDIKLTGLRTGT